jgi:hypothetical protein
MRRHWLSILMVAVVALAAGATFLWVYSPGKAKAEGPAYHAVLLTNGNVYFGKLEGLGGAYPVLRDVYYVQMGVDPATKQSKSVLLKRGKEWHAPDQMTLNANHIVLVEPVTANSQVASLIASSK